MRRPRQLTSRPPTDYAAGLLAVAVGVIIFLVASELFPYHSANHDEGVYLQQAAMLLDGTLYITAGDLSDAFRPWFFIQEAGRLIPRYAPIPAGMFAIGILLGAPRISLAFIAAGNVILCYLLVAAVFDRHRGLIAAVLLSVSPLFVFSSSVFLAYAPTTFLNLAFAVSYVYAAHRKHTGLAALAGLAIGVSFFARPFTAVLFAIPFVGHAAWMTGQGISHVGPGAGVVKRNVTTAMAGLLLVGVTLAYNAHLTGNPLLFPYEAFAPNDGIGFGRRALLGHSIEYTPSLALAANSHVIWYLLTRWFAAGVIGSLLALVGIVFATRGYVLHYHRRHRVPLTNQLRIVLVGSFGTVILGNFLFWGNVNILGSMSDPTDGLIALVGPVYHFDALIPLSAFAAHGALTAWARIRSLVPRITPNHHEPILVVFVLLSLLVLCGSTVALIDAPAERNAAHTANYQQLYEPFIHQPLTDALVFVPTPNGPWLNHPFQYLRNSPSLDGPVVFALDRDTQGNFEVIDAYPERSYYRFTYHGSLPAHETDEVFSKLEPVTVQETEALHGRTTVGIPPNADHATVRLENTTSSTEYVTWEFDDESLGVDWVITNELARISELATESIGPRTNNTVRVGGTETIRLSVQFVHADGTPLTYEHELRVQVDEDTIRVLWPGRQYVCPIVERCGHSGTYLPTHPEVHPTGVTMDHKIISTAPSNESPLS